jgi:DNA-binding XRE family transcriptional regulator
VKSKSSTESTQSPNEQPGREKFTDLWNSDVTRVLEWIDQAETCLAALDRQNLPKFANQIKLSRTRLQAAQQIHHEISTMFSLLRQSSEDQDRCDRIQDEFDAIETRIQSLYQRFDELVHTGTVIAAKESELFLNETIEPIPTGAPFISSLESQLRTDLWFDRDGTAVFSKVAKSNPQNYIEHYISSPGDVTMLPWDAAEKIINNFGFNTVKLQLIFAAHAMNQPEPWSSSFTLSGEDVIRNLGWNNRKDIPTSQKLAELAGCAFALDCLLVKVEWKEGGKVSRRKTQVTIQTSRMWNIAITATGQKNLLSENLENLEKVELQVQPGLWTKGFLNRGGAKAREALYQFGYLAQSVLRIDPYHNELALRLALHLTLESRIHTSGEYRVRTLLGSVLVGCSEKIVQAQSNRYKARDLVEQWNEALKTLVRLGWSVEFSDRYPDSLKPDSPIRKPKGYINLLLESKITIHPPEPIPELLTRKKLAKSKSSQADKQIAQVTLAPLTGEQVREARKQRGWSQVKLAGFLGISQQLISHIESGRREPTPEVEASLRKLLKL